MTEVIYTIKQKTDFMYIIIEILRAYKGKQETDAWMCGDAVWEEMWGVIQNLSGLLLSQWSHVFTLWLSGHALVRRAFHHLLREHTDVQLQAGQGIRWRAKVKYFIFISSLCGCLCETDCVSEGVFVCLQRCQRGHKPALQLGTLQWWSGRLGHQPLE